MIKKMQITIQKKFLILVEVSENIFRLFLIVITFVFNFAESKIEEVKENIWDFSKSIVSKTFNFIRALFGFNIYKLEILEIKTRTSEAKKAFKNNSFLIYSNLLAPPTL